MESGIEDGDVRRVGQQGPRRLDARDVGRVVEGREANVPLNYLEHALVD